MKTAGKKLRLLLAAFCLTMIVFLLLPLFFGFFSGGMVLLPFFAAVGYAAVRYDRLLAIADRKAKWGRAVLKVGIALLTAFGILLAGLSVWMAAWAARPADEQAQTVIVLGCKVYGDEPSTMLRRRLDTAIDWANKNPQSSIIVTGGKGNGEDKAEAEVMRNYLIANGIEPRRIYLENQAENTLENLELSAKIVRQNGLDSNAVVVTDHFHQLRAALFARKAGLEASPLSCYTQWYFLPVYWCRELLALLRALVLGF